MAKAKQKARSRLVTETVGRIRLKEWLNADGRSQEKLGAQLRNGGSKSGHVSQAAVAQWVSGVCRPEPSYRKALQKIAGIAVEDWDTAEERAQQSPIVEGRQHHKAS